MYVQQIYNCGKQNFLTYIQSQNDEEYKVDHLAEWPKSLKQTKKSF